MKKSGLRFNPDFGGANQIRTGVNGFADRYLTTRTWHQITDFAVCECKVNSFPLFLQILFSFFQKFFAYFCKKETNEKLIFLPV